MGAAVRTDCVDVGLELPDVAAARDVAVPAAATVEA
jgi:hypothetical protein